MVISLLAKEYSNALVSKENFPSMMLILLTEKTHKGQSDHRLRHLLYKRNFEHQPPYDHRDDRPDIGRATIEVVVVPTDS